jgi:xanthine dehydrogenase accessory factor
MEARSARVYSRLSRCAHVQPSLLREAASLGERGVACALATVVAATGSVPGKAGATMLVTVDGTTQGTVGGAGLEERVKALCVDALRRGEGSVHRFDLANWKPEGLDSVCGGSVEIAILIVKPTPHLLLVGGGHCAQALARVCDVLAWGYTIVDSRAAYATPDLFPRARALVHDAPAAYLAREENLTRFTHAYLVGHSHHEDGEALLALLARGFPGVIGVVGSRSKMHAFEERAAERGLSTMHVRSPIGVDVGADTPAEIAVAVAAEVIRDVKRPAPAGAGPSPFGQAGNSLSTSRTRVP